MRGKEIPRPPLEIRSWEVLSDGSAAPQWVSGPPPSYDGLFAGYSFMPIYNDSIDDWLSSMVKFVIPSDLANKPKIESIMLN